MLHRWRTTALLFFTLGSLHDAKVSREAVPPFVVSTVRAAASLSGVVTDSAGTPVSGATALIELRPALQAVSDGAGRYRLTDIPAGTHLVTVRALGYVSQTVTITFGPDAALTRDFQLRASAPVLDSVVVRAERADPRLLEFEENRRVGLGTFLTRAELEAQRGQSMAAILGKVNSVGIVRGMGNRGWILSRRPIISGSCRPGTPGQPMYGPDDSEKFQGMRCACYAQVYVDSQLMNPGQPAEPFDVNTYSPDQIEAIEWYASPAQTPSKYS